MRVVRSRTPSEQGTTGHPRMYTLPVGDIRCPRHGAVTLQVVHLVFNALQGFLGCVHNLL